MHVSTVEILEHENLQQSVFASLRSSLSRDEIVTTLMNNSGDDTTASASVPTNFQARSVAWPYTLQQVPPT